ncbi:MAG: phosphate/phosphite/phosphonate ABC transporter substrate-binding protein [Thermomicrobiales bacterium]
MNLFKKAAISLTALTLMVGAPATIAIAQSTPEASVAATPGIYDKTDWPSELNCGLFGGDDAEAALTGAGPLADYLAEWLGIPVEYTTGTSYNAVIESMASDHTNCGTVGPFSYLLGVQEAGAVALGVEVYANTENPVYDETLRPSYYSVISVKKGSGIASLADLKGHTFSFVDPASTSGYLIPSSDIVAAGLDPEKDITATFAGSHPTSVLALWNDKIDAAASTEQTLVNLAAEGQIDFCGFADGDVNRARTQADIDAVYNACPDGSIVAIHYSDPIPNTPFAVSSKLPQSLKQAIYDALMNTKNEPELIAAMGYWYTDPTGDSLDEVRLDAYYDPLRKVAEALGLDLKSFGS